jgi:superfamily II DNA/RNA helicase
MERRVLNFSDVKYFVLDEADEMLNMGFQEDVECILENIPNERQSMFFSATVPQWVRKLANKYSKKYIMVDLVGEDSTGILLPATSDCPLTFSLAFGSLLLSMPQC